MGVYILTEPIVRSRLWATRYAAGIREEAALGKHTMIEVAEPDYRGLAGKTVIVNAVTKTFCARVLPQLEAAEIRPLLLAPGKFSVRVDFESIYTGLLDELHRRGCRRTAFFGVNPDSLNDALKTDIFLAHGGREKDIYRNYGDLERCFDTYLQSLKHCDSVLFPNNVTASVFFRFCEERETDTHGLRFGTLGEVHCRTNEVIWSQFDCEEVGRQAVRCARFLDKCKEPAQFLYTVPGHIYGANLTRNPQPDDRPTVPVDYYGDQAVA